MKNKAYGPSEGQARIRGLVEAAKRLQREESAIKKRPKKAPAKTKS